MAVRVRTLMIPAYYSNFDTYGVALVQLLWISRVSWQAVVGLTGVSALVTVRHPPTDTHYSRMLIDTMAFTIVIVLPIEARGRLLDVFPNFVRDKESYE